MREPRIRPVLTRTALATAEARVLARKHERTAGRAIPVARPCSAALERAIRSKDSLHGNCGVPVLHKVVPFNTLARKRVQVVSGADALAARE